MPTIKCPHCDAEIDYREEWIGQNARCPGCQQLVPLSTDVPLLRARSSTSSRTRMRIIGFCLAITATAAVCSLSLSLIALRQSNLEAFVGLERDVAGLKRELAEVRESSSQFLVRDIVIVSPAPGRVLAPVVKERQVIWNGKKYINHGRYRSHFVSVRTGKVVGPSASGFYKNDKRSGPWVVRVKTRKTTTTGKGSYRAGKQIGIWTFTDEKGNVWKKDFGTPMKAE